LTLVVFALGLMFLVLENMVLLTCLLPGSPAILVSQNETTFQNSEARITSSAGCEMRASIENQRTEQSFIMLLATVDKLL